MTQYPRIRVIDNDTILSYAAVSELTNRAHVRKERGFPHMPRVEVRNDESLEKALRRFKRMLEREGTLKALKAKKHYEKPSERKRRELRQAISRRARTM